MEYIIGGFPIGSFPDRTFPDGSFPLPPPAVSGFTVIADTGSGNQTYDFATFAEVRGITQSNSSLLYCKIITNFDAPVVTDISSLFYQSTNLVSVDLSEFDTGQVTDMHDMFGFCGNLKTAKLEIDTGNVIDMARVFSVCEHLEVLDLRTWDTSKVTGTAYMFTTCADLTTIYVTELWSMASVTQGNGMFHNCTSLVGAIAFDPTKTDYTYANYLTGYLTYRSLVPSALDDVSLTSTIQLGGSVLHSTLEVLTLSAQAGVLVLGALEGQLEDLSSAGIGRVAIKAQLGKTLGGLRAISFGEVYTGIDSPYEDVLSWTGHPLTGARVRVRIGNLHGIFKQNNEFGIYAGTGWNPQSKELPSASSQYIRLGSFTNEFHNIPIKLYDGNDLTMLIEPDAPSFSMGNPLPAGYDVGTGLWQGKDTDGVYKWRIGNPTGANLDWDGVSLTLNQASLDISGGTSHLALGNPPPSSRTSGTGIWMDNTGIYGLNNDVKQIHIDTTTGILYSGSGTTWIDSTGANINIGTLDENNRFTGVEINSTGVYGKVADDPRFALGLSGLPFLKLGEGTKDVDLTGIQIDSTKLVTQNAGVNQVVIDTDGRLYAGAGNVVVDANGINAGEGKVVISGSGASITIGTSPNIQLASNRIEGYTIDNATWFLLGSLSGKYGLGLEPGGEWGMGIGDSSMQGGYMRYYKGVLTIKGSLQTGNDNIYINENGILVTKNPLAGGLTPLVRYGVSSDNLKLSLAGSHDAELVLGELATTAGAVPSELDIKSRSDASAIARVQASNSDESESATITVSAAPGDTSISLDATKVSIKGGEVKDTAVPGGIPQANAMGKLDASWLPDTEDDDSGDYTVPKDALILWGGLNAPSGFSFETNLNNDRFVMGHTSNDFSTSRGSATHNHTNPATLEGGGHNNHSIVVSQSDVAQHGTDTFNGGTVYFVGAHSHAGTGSEESTAGNHTHTGGTVATASNLPRYRRLRWIRATADTIAPIGSIIMMANADQLNSDWKICNGSNGTYNMTDYFIYSGGTSGSDTGGATSHTHSVGATGSAGAHTHTLRITSDTAEYTGLTSDNGWGGAMSKHQHDSATLTSASAGAHTHSTAATGSAPNKPPCIALQFWQRTASGNEAAFPIGTIMIWGGAGNIPTTWRQFSEMNGRMPKGVAAGESIGAVYGTAYGSTHYHTAGALSSVAGHQHGSSGSRTSFSYSSASGSKGWWGSGGGSPISVSLTHTHTSSFYLNTANSHTHTLASANTSAASINNTLPPYRYAMFMVRQSLSPDGSSVPEPVFLSTPLSSASWDLTAKSTTGKTLLDLSAVFGAPAGIKAVLIEIAANDSSSAGGSANGGPWFIIAPNNTSSQGMGLNLRYEPNDAPRNFMATCPCNANGDIYYQIQATGVLTMDVRLLIWGYWV